MPGKCHGGHFTVASEWKERTGLSSSETADQLGFDTQAHPLWSADLKEHGQTQTAK